MTALTAIPSMTRLNASHQREARKKRGATALAAATMKQITMPATMTREAFSGCRLVIDLGTCRVVESFGLPPVGLGEGLLLMKSREIRERGSDQYPFNPRKQGASSSKQ